MTENDTVGFWAVMFWHFHGLGRGSGRFVGEMLAARYAETTQSMPPQFADLLAQLEAAEADAPIEPHEEGGQISTSRLPSGTGGRA
jgi:hypothetical protein